MTDERSHRIIQTDPRPTGELIQLLVSLDEEEDDYFSVLAVLHYRGTHEVLESARHLCRSIIPKERLAGVDILMKQGASVRMLREARAYLATTSHTNTDYAGKQENNESIVQQLSDVIGEAREYPKEAISALLPLLAEEEDAHVLTEVVIALGWYLTYDPRVIEQLALFIHYPNSDLRQSLAMSLADNHPVAIDALISLSVDKDEQVRNWATFELAQLSDDGGTTVDTVQIRDALYARIHDEEPIVRYEAFRGMAERADPRVIEPLINEPLEQVTDDTYSEALIDAGKNIGDPRLLPALLWVKEHGCTWWGDTHHDMSDDEHLLEAIARCLPNIA